MRDDGDTSMDGGWGSIPQKSDFEPSSPDGDFGADRPGVARGLAWATLAVAVAVWLVLILFVGTWILSEGWMAEEIGMILWCGALAVALLNTLVGVVVMLFNLKRSKGAFRLAAAGVLASCLGFIAHLGWGFFVLTQINIGAGWH